MARHVAPRSDGNFRRYAQNYNDADGAAALNVTVERGKRVLLDFMQRF
jgi:hypothetical protein